MLHLRQKRITSEPQAGKPQFSKDLVSISRLRSGHHPDLKYWLHKIGRVLDTVCWKCGMGEETVENLMGEYPRNYNPAAQLQELYLLDTNPHKAMELVELWKAKPDLPGISQPGQHD